MASQEIVVEVIVAEIDVALCIVEVPQDLAVQNWPKEFVSRVAGLITVLDSLLIALELLDLLIESMKKYLAVGQLVFVLVLLFLYLL